VRAQIGSSGDHTNKLYEIDLRFDPYSDTAESDYEELKAIVDGLDIRALLDNELDKAQPDAFLVTQIGRTLRLHDPRSALQLCQTLLSQQNLHAFRGSWSAVMRGIASICADDRFSEIHDVLDKLLDAIPVHSPHLLLAEVSCLHYLKAIRFRRTQDRAAYVLRVHSTTSSQTVRRGCLECWRSWKDRPSFIRERNRWNSLGAEEQRMLWCLASEFGDEGFKFRQQVKRSLGNAWTLGIERANSPTFASVYRDWNPR
jgi:hypothetical protein